MALQVVNGAVLQCSFGAAPGTFVVLPIHRVLVEKQPAANILDHVPMVNIPSFGACSSLANPSVASATSAALGVLTPMPCVPATTTPWTPGAPTVPLDRQPTLNHTSCCQCMWGGTVTVAMPGQATVHVP